jgi:hypothetical protein
MFASFLNRYGMNVDMENLSGLGFDERNRLFNETCAHLAATIQGPMVILLDDIQTVRFGLSFLTLNGKLKNLLNF